MVRKLINSIIAGLILLMLLLVADNGEGEQQPSGKPEKKGDEPGNETTKESADEPFQDSPEQQAAAPQLPGDPCEGEDGEWTCSGDDGKTITFDEVPAGLTPTLLQFDEALLKERPKAGFDQVLVILADIVFYDENGSAVYVFEQTVTVELSYTGEDAEDLLTDHGEAIKPVYTDDTGAGSSGVWYEFDDYERLEAESQDEIRFRLSVEGWGDRACAYGA